MTFHAFADIVPGLPPRGRVTVYEDNGTTHPSLVDEGLRAEISPSVDADDDSRVVFFVRRPRSDRYVLRWDNGGETTVTASPL